MVNLGPYHFHCPVILAPMAGVSDRPFRQICRRHGADYAVSEMISSDPRLRTTRKTQHRLDCDGETGPRIVQIAGADSGQLALAAKLNIDEGAEIIDINMGCPAKKVCNKMAGSALLKDEVLVGRLLEAVVRASEVPVTLKIRTGWDLSQRNAVTIARIAQWAGVQALAVHGRTRACGYAGEAEYETIAEIKAAIEIPVIANGDINTPARARHVLDSTGVDGIMIGRAARGNPWIFRDIKAYLTRGERLAPPARKEFVATIREHVEGLHEFYGPDIGMLVARKHVAWYVKRMPGNDAFRRTFNRLGSPDAQLAQIDNYQYNYQGALAA